MPGALALISAVALTALPPLPARGLARETKAGVQLQTMAGRPLATLPGLDLAPDKATGQGLVMRDRRAHLSCSTAGGVECAGCTNVTTA